MVPRDEELPVRRLEPGKGRDVVAQRRDEPVGHVARQRDEVGRQRVGPRDHALHEGPLQRGPHVQIRELDDAEPLEVARQIRDRHVDPHDPGPAGAPGARRGQRHRAAQHRDTQHARVHPRTRVQDIRGEREHDEQRRQAHRREAGPFQGRAERHPLRPAREKRRERRHDEEQHPGASEGERRGTEPRMTEQPDPDVHVQ